VALVGSGHSLGGFAGGNVTARLLIVVSGNTAQLQSSLAGASSSIESFNTGATRLGNALIRSVTLPILGLGAAAVKLATDFQAALARVAGLTPILDETGISIDQLGNRIIALASDPKIIAAPKDLADAMYFAGSAGLSAAEAFQVVELSAKGASVGMGQASEIARVLIFALNTFRSQGLTAAGAMDTLTVAIREGTAEPDELAIALGRLLPVARQVGLSFSEVVASVAALTNIGLPVRVATTSLRALFTELLAPTKQANDELKALGLTAQQVRDAVKAGPVVAFNLLIQATHGNIDALHQIVPQIRGFTALLGLTGDQAGHVSEIYNKTAHATGALDHALEIMSRTTAFQFQKALNDLRIAGIQLGQQLIPVFKGIFGVVGDMARTFSALSPAGKTAVAVLLTLAAATGPLIKLWGALNTGGLGLFGTFQSVGTGLGLIAVSSALAFAGFDKLSGGSANLQTVLLTTIATFVATRLALSGLQAALYATSGSSALLYGAFSTLVSFGPQIAIAFTALVVGLGYIIGKSHEAAQSAGHLQDALTNLGTETILTKKVLEDIGNKAGSLKETFLEAAKAAGAIGQPIQKGLGETLLQVNKQLADLGPSIEKNFAIPPRFIDVLGETRGKVIGIGDAWRKAGLNEQQFLDLVSGRKGAPQIEALVRSSDALANSYAEIRKQTEATILLHSADQAAVDRLAKAYGVDGAFIQKKLSDVGTSALGMTDITTGALNDTGQAFGKAAGLIDETTGQMIAAQEEEAEKEAEIQAKRQEALQGTIDLFGELPKKVEASVAKLTANAGAVANVFIKEAQNAQTLLKRGLDPAVLQFLVDKGPEFVAKFVNASGKELKKLERAYQLSMAATDAIVLQEGKHQEGKAQDMIGAFAEALLSNKNLPVAATKKVLAAVIGAIDNKKIGQKGLDLIEGFAAALTGPGALNLTGAAAGQVLQRVVNAFLSGKINATGIAVIENFAAGLNAVGDMPVARARAINEAFISALLAGDFKGAGFKSIENFANGIISDEKVPPARALDIAQAVANALGLQITVSYRNGQVHVEQFIGGINSRSKGAVDAAANVGESAAGAFNVPGAFTSGQRLGLDFAKGITSQISAAAAAAVRMGEVTVAALNDALTGSPRLFTYYLGQDLVKQLGQGIDQRQKLPSLKRPALSQVASTPVGVGGEGGSRTVNNVFNIHKANMDAQDLSRETAWLSLTDGWG
jgi:TP901 family phage tail tape measure protein